MEAMFKTGTIEHRPGTKSDEKQHIVNGWVSTVEVDECGDVMVPQGVDATYLDRHKSVNIGHSRDPEKAIGSHRWHKVHNDRGVMVQFSMGTNAAGREASLMIREKVLNCLSIEFGGIDCGHPTAAERQKYGHDCKCIYRTWKLRGYALVAQPMNAGAVITETKALVDDWLLRRIRAGKVTVDTAKRLGWEERTERLVLIPNGWVLKIPAA